MKFLKETFGLLVLYTEDSFPMSILITNSCRHD